MKVYDIIAEDNKQLNEIAPILGGITVAGLLGALSAFLTGLSIYDIYQILKKRDFDIDKMTEDDYGELAIDLLMLAIPGAGKFARATVAKMIPNSVKKLAAQRVQKHLLPLRKQLKGELAVANKTAVGAERDAIKAAAISKYKASAEKIYASKVTGPIKTTIGAIAAGTLFVDYYAELQDLEDQWDRVCNKGDTTTKLFGSMSCEEATAVATEHRKKLLGELTIGIAAAVAAAPVAKLVNGLGSIIGTPVAWATGSRLAGGVVKLPATIVAKIIQIGGPGLALVMQTEEGKKFLSNAIIEEITTKVGAITSGTLSLLYAAIEKVAEKMGLDATPITEPFKSKIAAAADKDFTDRYEKDPAPTPQLSVRKDPKNPKIVSVGGIQITDATGKRIASDTVIKQIQKTADAWNYPDPTAGLGS